MCCVMMWTCIPVQASWKEFVFIKMNTCITAQLHINMNTYMYVQVYIFSYLRIPVDVCMRVCAYACGLSAF